MLANVAQEVVNAVVDQASDDLELLKALRATSSIFHHATCLTFRACRFTVADDNLATLLALLRARPHLIRHARSLSLVAEPSAQSPPAVSNSDLLELVRLAPRLEDFILHEFEFILGSPEGTDLRTLMTLSMAAVTRIVEHNIIVDFLPETITSITPQDTNPLYPSAGPLRLRHRNAVAGYTTPGPRAPLTWFFGGENLLPNIAVGLHAAFMSFKDTLTVLYMDMALFPYTTNEWASLGAQVCTHLRVVNIHINLHTFNRRTNSTQGFNLNRLLRTLPISVSHLAVHFAFAHADSPAFSAHVARMDWRAIGLSLRKLSSLRVVAINLCPRTAATSWRVEDTEHIEDILKPMLVSSTVLHFLHPDVTGDFRTSTLWALEGHSLDLNVKALENIL